MIAVDKANKKTTSPSRGAGELRDEAPIEDTSAVKRLFQGFAARAGIAKGKKKPA